MFDTQELLANYDADDIIEINVLEDPTYKVLTDKI